jgi:Asp-tRNA(Asn)/Glu-tRNA(Gln) amidotransferase A subunit family amidase
MYAEAASAFENITLNDTDDLLKRQDQWAWPNIFRCARFISAIDYVQGDRIRRKAMDEMRRIFTQVDIIVAPILTGPMLMLTNFTGHPSICLRSGFMQSGTRGLGTILGGRFEPPVVDSSDVYRVPQGISFIGRLFEEERLIVLADQLEQKLGIAAERPSEFS